MSDTVEFYNKNGCIHIEEFLDSETVELISLYLENKIKRGEWVSGLEPGPFPTTAMFYYGDPLIEVLLLKCTKSVENIVGKELIPTYSYARIYQPGEKLLPHKDRQSCEVSVTVNVASKGKSSPIFMQYFTNYPKEYILKPGDAVIYKGCEAVHWRFPLEEDDQLVVQFMLHYVDKNGVNAVYAKDTRPEYGMPVETKQGVKLCQRAPQK